MMNNVSLIGRLANDPELRTTTSGTNVTSVTVAVDRDRKNADGTRDADFIRVTVWGSSASFLCDNFKKGDYISVQGHLHNNVRIKDDVTIRELEVIGDKISFCGYRRPAQ